MPVVLRSFFFLSSFSFSCFACNGIRRRGKIRDEGKRKFVVSEKERVGDKFLSINVYLMCDVLIFFFVFFCVCILILSSFGALFLFSYRVDALDKMRIFAEIS